MKTKNWLPKNLESFQRNILIICFLHLISMCYLFHSSNTPLNNSFLSCYLLLQLNVELVTKYTFNDQDIPVCCYWFASVSIQNLLRNVISVWVARRLASTLKLMGTAWGSSRLKFKCTRINWACWALILYWYPIHVIWSINSLFITRRLELSNSEFITK